MGKNGVREMNHYLDNFLVLDAQQSRECEGNLAKLLWQAEWLGFPIAEEKVEGPSMRPTFWELRLIPTHLSSNCLVIS